MATTLLASEKNPATPHSIEVSIKGKWLRVPALNVNGSTLVVRGKWLRLASVHDEEWSETELSKPELSIRSLKELASPRSRTDIFTFCQKLPGTLPKYDYHVEWDSIAAVHTTSFADWWQKLPQETRKNVRRSQKRGVVVTVEELNDSLIRAIMDVNDDSPLRQGVPYTHYRKSFGEVKKDQSSFLDRCDYICAYLGSELIGFLKLVYRGEIASILLLLPKASHYDKRPANALLAKAVEICEAKGVSYLTYGMFNHGNKHDSPLREFKIRNGFEEMLTPRYYVPLTRWGAACLRLGLHRGIHAILPHPIIAAGISARAKWYHLRQSISRCSSMAEQPRL